MKNVLKIGLVGCGAFGQFCLDTFSKMDEVLLTAIMDSDKALVKKTAAKFNTSWYTDFKKFLLRADVELVHLVTPPETHYKMGMQALRAEKHVLCEKPLALSTEQGKEMIAEAAERNLILPVNFVLRYAPVTDMVHSLIQSGIMGAPLRAYFENYATDANLDSGHWFWNKKQSGGIFVEHGVHFFDLYNYWLGDADLLWAHTEKRNSGSMEDRVFCVLRHRNGAVSTHYHGFDQPPLLDRQIHKLLFERGDVSVYGWIPQSISVYALVDDSGLNRLEQIMQKVPDYSKRLAESNKRLIGRGKEFIVSHEVRFDYQDPADKLTIYRQSIQHLLRDQLKKIENRKHKRVITEENGLKALELAVEADNSASRL
ncbi:MAG: gfo/Idh/MocA family oxidoreductase [Calditrichaeota bacterium]|nr:Gfo/Idh/MocA family oxidoreductase [Calditrichota bacterium]RQW02843.1 MAG: gfo/Idh/MocA family oxidoreductase [Calditrichota bacterium]